MNDIVNPQITDSVTQANVKVLGDAPAIAMGAIYQSLAHSTGILFENATSAQQQQQILAQAATNVGVMQLYSAATGGAGADVPDNLLSLLTALRANTDPSAAIAAARQAAEAILTPAAGAPQAASQGAAPAARQAPPAAKAKPQPKAAAKPAS